MMLRRFRLEGFSFVEIMTAVAILSLGIVMIFRSFFTSVNYLNHMTYRLHALNILSNRIELLHQRLRLTGKIVIEDGTSSSMILDGRTVYFAPTMQIKEVKESKNLYMLNASVSWQESGRHITISRNCYLYRDHAQDPS